MAKPLQVGVAQNVVAEISCDRDALEWIADHLPADDEFTKDLIEALTTLDREDEEEAEYVREIGRPTLSIMLGIR